MNPLAAQRVSRFPENTRFSVLATDLSNVGSQFYARGWVLGTSGNFSAVLSTDPLRLVITSSGLDKGNLAAEHFLEVDESGNVVRGNYKPSAEMLLHLEIAHGRGAGAVLHTHSVWSTVLSELCAEKGGLAIEGFEMLKGLRGVQTHEHREWLPLVENSQAMNSLAQVVSRVLQENPSAHGFLLKQHGLYTWGADIAEAKRHVEILEFLMETMVWRIRVRAGS